MSYLNSIKVGGVFINKQYFNMWIQADTLIFLFNHSSEDRDKVQLKTEIRSKNAKKLFIMLYLLLLNNVLDIIGEIRVIPSYKNYPFTFKSKGMRTSYCMSLLLLHI